MPDDEIPHTNELTPEDYAEIEEETYDPRAERIEILKKQLLEQGNMIDLLHRTDETLAMIAAALVGLAAATTPDTAALGGVADTISRARHDAGTVHDSLKAIAEIEVLRSCQRPPQ